MILILLKYLNCMLKSSLYKIVFTTIFVISIFVDLIYSDGLPVYTTIFCGIILIINAFKPYIR